MNLRGVQPGDIVEIDHKGRHYLAFVVDKVRAGKGWKLRTRPITPNITWTEAKATQVIGHWSQREGRSRGAAHGA